MHGRIAISRPCRFGFRINRCDISLRGNRSASCSTSFRNMQCWGMVDDERLKSEKVFEGGGGSRGGMARSPTIIVARCRLDYLGQAEAETVRLRAGHLAGRADARPVHAKSQVFSGDR